MLHQKQNSRYTNASFMRIKSSAPFLLKQTLICFLLAVSFQPVKAQTDSIYHQKNTSNQDLFLSKFEAYKTSKNRPGLLAVADHNHYPSPEKVLLWQKELRLNDRQKTTINQINTGLKKKVSEMNNFLITNERTMDSLFRYKKINNGLLIFYTNRYGLYQGELRNALLQACLKTEAQLSATQIKKYDSLLQD